MSTNTHRTYFFALGRNPTLSLAELEAVLSNHTPDYSVQHLSTEIVVITSQKDIDIQDVLATLGGCIKAGRVFGWIMFDEQASSFEEFFEADTLLPLIPQAQGKVHLGMSLYNAGADQALVNRIFGQCKGLLLLAKENISKAGRNAGFVQVKDRILSSVSVEKNQLISHGCEIVLVVTPSGIGIGKTDAVQDFASFGLRDMLRPSKDKRSGIMPPKLARIMINMARAVHSDVLLDPFCGSGTILTEAVLLGYKTLLGSDITEKAVTDTQKNLEWLFETFRTLSPPKYSIDVKVGDVRTLPTLFSVKPDAIITEPFLGPPLVMRPDIRKAETIVKDITPLYHDAITQFSRVLTSGGSVVMVLPAIKTEKQFFLLPVLPHIESRGFRIQSLITKELHHPAITLSERKTILYGSPDQFVFREIVCFKKNS